jgi:dTDP-4-dehydrorhamnose reductase
VSKPRIVIVGSGGRLGSALLREWRTDFPDICGFARRDLDLGDEQALHERLDPIGFDVLVNCAAQTNVDRCETEQEEAMRLNARAPEILGEIASKKGAQVIHISTDYVFDGEKRTPYTEDDPVRPISVYGESKRAGETRLLAVSDHHLVVRVSWVFGPDRPSFVDGILKRALAEERVDAIGDKVAVPTYTLDAAHLLRPFLDDVNATGVLHLCNDGECTWQQYGQHAIDCAVAAGVPLKARTVDPLKMADLKAFIAKRPIYTAMSTTKLAQLTGRAVRPWREAVAAYVRDHWAPAQARG